MTGVTPTPSPSWDPLWIQGNEGDGKTVLIVVLVFVGCLVLAAATNKRSDR